MVKNQVTAKQFFSLLYISLLSTVFMYLSSPNIKLSQTDTLLRPFVFMVVALVVGVPILLIYKRHKELELNRQYIKKSAFLKLVAIIYAVVYFISIVKTIARFDLFVSSEVFPNADMFIFLVAIIFVCALLSLSGLGALSRSALIFLVLVGGATVVVMISLREEIDILNFTPIFQNGVKSFAEDGFIFSAQALEIGAITFFLPHINGNIKKTFIGWSVLSAVSFSVIFLFVVGSLGVFADTQLFPTYTAVSLASFGLLERIDALETGVWIICAVEKLALYFLIAANAVSYAFKGASQRVVTAVCFVLATLFSVIISRNIEHFSFLSSNLLAIVLFVVVAVILPVSLAIYVRRVRPCEKVDEGL